MDQLGLGLDAHPALDLSSLDDEERAVVGALRWGRAHARKVRALAAATGIPGRRVQELVAHLIDEHAVPIGTAMSDPHGNYLMDDTREIEATAALLRARGLSTLHRATTLERIAQRMIIDGAQPRMPGV